MEHTKGKVEVRYNMILSKDKNDFTIASVGTIGIPKTEAYANLSLIADAFNTTNKSGLTPSQLYKQNQELLEALKELVYELTGEQECEDELEKGLGITLAMRVRQAQQAINNAKTK